MCSVKNSSITIECPECGRVVSAHPSPSYLAKVQLARHFNKPGPFNKYIPFPRSLKDCPGGGTHIDYEE